MTTVMLVAAMVPIALGQGPGAGARASMAKVIIGGQMLSLVLALLVTPVFYALLDMVTNLARRLGIRFSVEPSPTGSRHIPHLVPTMNGEHDRETMWKPRPAGGTLESSRRVRGHSGAMSLSWVTAISLSTTS